MVRAIAGAPTPGPEQRGEASTIISFQAGKRSKPLTEQEERVLLGRIHQAQILGRLREELATTSDGGAVTVELWARKAGLQVLDLQAMLQEASEAKQILVERNMPMVYKIVEQQYRWRLRGAVVSIDDLVQEGAYALGLAADRFDPLSKNRFLTYAVFVIRDKLDTAVARNDLAISVPVTALKEFYSAKRYLALELGRAPSDKELERYFVDGVLDISQDASPGETGTRSEAEESLLTLVNDGPGAAGGESGSRGGSTGAKRRKRRMDLMTAVRRVASLDSTIRDADGNPMSLMETLAASNADPLRHAGDGMVSSLLPKVLTPREAYLVRMVCGLVDGRPRTVAECADKLCLSVKRTKALLDASLEKLRLAAIASKASSVMVS